MANTKKGTPVPKGSRAVTGKSTVKAAAPVNSVPDTPVEDILAILGKHSEEAQNNIIGTVLGKFTSMRAEATSAANKEANRITNAYDQLHKVIDSRAAIQENGIQNTGYPSKG